MSGGNVVAWRVANRPDGPFALRKTKPIGWACIEPLVLQSDLAAAIARAEAAERERDDLRHAIRQHRDTFPDEPLNGELTLWAAIADQQAEGEDRG